MRVKTFLATYLLFLVILFSSFGFVSVYLMNNQINMLINNGTTGFQTISASLARDIGVLSGRFVDPQSDDFLREVDTLMRGYARYYRQHNIRLELIHNVNSVQCRDIVTSFITDITSGGSYIFATGVLSETLAYFRFNYFFDVSQSISDVRAVQRNLLFICIVFSVVAAFALHFIVRLVFRPLAIVAKSARGIADGNFSERIRVGGNGELLEVVHDFNKMAERVESQLIQKQQFVDNFAHEIRTPLTSIYANAEYLEKAALTEEEIIESAQTVKSEAGHMRKIANSLLELATLRNYQPVKGDVFIPRLFEDVSKSLKETMYERGAELICHYDVEVVKAQEDLVKSLLLNLCTNALNACENSQGVITLEARKRGYNIVLSVSDNGQGIPLDKISQVIEPFYRVDAARSRGGVGLGLTLCKQIADAHGAMFSIESNVGAGTKVEVTFTGS